MIETQSAANIVGTNSDIEVFFLGIDVHVYHILNGMVSYIVFSSFSCRHKVYAHL